MIVAIIVIAVILAVLVAVLMLGSVRVIRPDERGVVFRYGRVQDQVRGPGTTMIVPAIDRLERVSMQTRVAEVPVDDVVTRDNVAMRLGAAVHVHVVDPVKATVSVADYLSAISQVAKSSLRSFIGHCDFDELAASDRTPARDRASGEAINAQLREVIAEPTEEPWGLRVERVEIVVPKPQSQGSSSPGR